MAQTLNAWVEKAEADSGRKPDLTTDLAAKLKLLDWYLHVVQPLQT
jgi:hypothetical protein